MRHAPARMTSAMLHCKEKRTAELKATTISDWNPIVINMVIALSIAGRSTVKRATCSPVRVAP
ncbi:hypothetical protein D1872_286950 [compost metagenome]